MKIKPSAKIIRQVDFMLEADTVQDSHVFFVKEFDPAGLRTFRAAWKDQNLAAQKKAGTSSQLFPILGSKRLDLR